MSAGAALAWLTIGSTAEANRHRGYSPPYAAIVIDANTGRVLHASNADARRFPASITKVMTLYMLFEQLEQGNVNLRTPVPFSANASRQPPSKIGVRPGGSITVEQAILAMITKSGNDVAVAVAELIGGSEEQFARLMTARARQLGMRNTTFANASGLPNSAQVTTARDLTILGRAVQEHFPKYYRYFGTRSFRFGNARFRNHNRLLGTVTGVDGIKTGFTRASGFNLLTSARQGNRHIIAVVLGGRSGAARNQAMTRLVANNIGKAATRRAIAAIPKPSAGAAQVAARSAPIAAAVAAPLPPARPAALVRTVEATTPAAAPPARTVVAAAPPLPAPPAARAPAGQPVLLSAYANPGPVGQPAVISGTLRTGDLIPTASIPNAPAAIEGSTRSHNANTGGATSRTSTPSELRWISRQPTERRIALSPAPLARSPAPVPPAPVPVARVSTPQVSAPQASAPQAAAAPTAPAQAAQAPSPATGGAPLTERPEAARSGLMIQVGATDDLARAQDLLDKARARSGGVLAGAKPFTETIQRNGTTLYRARFAGLDRRTAQTACRTLKRSGLACFATAN